MPMAPALPSPNPLYTSAAIRHYPPPEGGYVRGFVFHGGGLWREESIGLQAPICGAQNLVCMPTAAAFTYRSRRLRTAPPPKAGYSASTSVVTNGGWVWVPSTPYRWSRRESVRAKVA